MSRRLALLTLAAVGVRLVSGFNLRVLSHDSAHLLQAAHLWKEGRFTEALELPPAAHPLFPLLAAAGETLTGLRWPAAVVLSSVLGGLGLLPLHAMARRLGGDRLAAVTSVLYAFLPDAVEVQGNALTYGPFFFFFLWGMDLAWTAFERASWERALLAGLSTAAAWLTRPEGIYLVPLLFLAAVVRPRRFALLGIALALAAAFVGAFPYLAFIKARTGRAGITYNPLAKGVFGLVTGETPATGYQVTEKTAQEFGEYRYIDRYGRLGGPVLYVAKTSARVLFYILVPFLAIGLALLVRTPRPAWPPAGYLLAAAGGAFIPPVLAFVAATPFSYRYILLTFVLLLPVAAAGILWTADRLPRPDRALPILLSLLCLSMTVRSCRPRNRDRLALKEAGQWILKRYGPGIRMAGTRREIEYYARGEFTVFPSEITYEALLKIIHDQRLKLVALYEPDLRHMEPELERRLAESFRRVGQIPENPDRSRRPVRLYWTGGP